jgi:hypothetical protein
MKASELRIGNYIYVSAPKEHILEARNQSIEKANYHHFNDICRCNKEWVYEPIPLTEDWLLKFGFKNKYKEPSEVFELNIGNNNIIIDLYELLQSTYLEHRNFAINIGKLKYVHQLQNLYFALTGEELEIKEYATH